MIFFEIHLRFKFALVSVRKFRKKIFPSLAFGGFYGFFFASGVFAHLAKVSIFANNTLFSIENLFCKLIIYGLSHARREHERANLFLQGTDSEPSLYKVGLLFSLQFMAYFEKKRGALSYKVGNITEKDLIRPGHYNEDGIVKMLQNAFSNHPLSISTHTLTHNLIIGRNKNTAGFWFDEDLAKILDISPKVMAKEHFVSMLDLPNSYYIHCDLVSKDLNLHNGEPSDILACIPISGNPQERVTCLQNF